MAFLDNLISDLIRNSTGFNAKPFVRAVGGKNILLLGGAAIAGALAAEKMRAQQQAQGVPPVPVPPLPPLPSAGPTAAVPPLPPLPTAAPAEPELPRDLVFAIVRTMVSGALSDGEMHAEEKKLIEGRLGESGLSSDETKQIHKDLVFPPTPEEIGTMVSTTEDRELLYRFGALVVRSQGGESGPEKAWLDRLGGALGLGPERRAGLESEIFGAT
jgi:uncharacterized membrane protein YebE (DUF533 family)